MPTPQRSEHRNRLSELEDHPFLTDGGLETTLLFHEGWELPGFSSVPLATHEAGRAAIRTYYDRYLPLAYAHRAGFILESPTWRASPDWAETIGYDLAALEQANRDAIALMAQIRADKETETTPILISGCIGPRGDGYVAGALMTPEEAERYHAWQVNILADAGVDMISAFTFTNVPEAIGFTRAVAAAGVPCVISFTVETDGRLPTGDLLKDAIAAVDAACKVKPAYYMINCAHPSHFEPGLEAGAAWMKRVRGLRANASKCSHAELDQAEELDTGNPDELGREYRAILERFPHITVLGGCCGTDHRHIAAISAARLETA